MEQQQDYTIDQVANIVQVNRKSVEKWIQAGELEAYELGGRYRIRPNDLDTFREKRRVKPKRGKQITQSEEGLALAG